MSRFAVILAVLVLFGAGAAVGARGADQRAAGRPIDGQTRGQVIDRALGHLEREYVYPDIAQKMTEAVRRRQRNKEYDSVIDGRAFAELLTAHLREVSKDKHLEIEFSDEPRPESPAGEAATAEREKRGAFLRAVNHGFDKVERLGGNVGYIGLRTFAPVTAAADKAAAAMNLLGDTDALIVDLRYNGGGDPKTVQFLCSYLFGEEPVHLNSMYWRTTDSTQQVWTLAHVPGRRYLDKPVYVLTSGQTASGAEEYAYNLRNLKRATIVGETTAGAANPGGTVRLHPHFGMFLPRGRSINPVTKTSWEGVGVKPDVAVPADRAFQQAYLLALKDVRRRGNYAGPEPLDELIGAAQRDLDALTAAAGK